MQFNKERQIMVDYGEAFCIESLFMIYERSLQFQDHLHFIVS